MLEKAKFLRRLYEDFFVRDLSIIFSGCLLIVIIVYSFEISMSNLLELITKNYYTFILFLISSYVIGVFLYSLAPICRLVPKKVLTPKTIKDTVKVYTDIEKKFGIFSIKQLERLLFFRNFFSTIGMAFFFGIFSVLCHYIIHKNSIDIILIILFSCLFILSVISARKYNESYEKSLTTLGMRTFGKN